MSDGAFAIGEMVRFHEVLSPRPAVESQDAVLRALHADGFSVAPDAYESEGWSIRYAVIGENAASTRANFLLEIVPLLSLVGVRRPFARCAVPIAVRPDGPGARLICTTVWGHKGDQSTVNLVARRTRISVERAAAQLGATTRSSLPAIDLSAPVDAKAFQRLTGWRDRP